MSPKLTPLRLPEAMARYEGRLSRPSVDASASGWVERLTGRSLKRLQHDRLRLAITVAGRKLLQPTEEAFQEQPFTALLDALGDASLPSTDGSAPPALWSHVVVRLFASQNVLAPAERAFAELTMQHALSSQVEAPCSAPKVQPPTSSRLWRWRYDIPVITVLTGGLAGMVWLTMTQPSNVLLQVVGWTMVGLAVFLSPLWLHPRRRSQRTAGGSPMVPPIKWSLDQDSAGLGQLVITLSEDQRMLTLVTVLEGDLVARSLTTAPCALTNVPSRAILRGHMVLRDVPGEEALHVVSEVGATVSGPAHTSLQTWLDRGASFASDHSWVKSVRQVTYGGVMTDVEAANTEGAPGARPHQVSLAPSTGAQGLAEVSRELYRPC